MTPTRRAVPAALLSRRVDGYRIPAGSTLGDVVDEHGPDRTTLLVFLRHYG